MHLEIRELMDLISGMNLKTVEQKEKALYKTLYLHGINPLTGILIMMVEMVLVQEAIIRILTLEDG